VHSILGGLLDTVRFLGLESQAEGQAGQAAERMGNAEQTLAQLISFLLNKIPSIFTIPADVRTALPGDVQTWLTSVETRVDGMTLPKIEKEAKGVAGSVGDPKRIYRLGRRVFYARLQAIWDIMYPDSGLEVGIDLLCNPFGTDIPGAVVNNILFGEEPSNGDVLQESGILDNCREPKKDQADE